MCVYMSLSLMHVRLCDPTDCSPPGSPVQGIPQARILEWVTISSSRGSSNPGIKFMSPASPALQADSLSSESPGKHLKEVIKVK